MTFVCHASLFTPSSKLFMQFSHTFKNYFAVYKPDKISKPGWTSVLLLLQTWQTYKQSTITSKTYSIIFECNNFPMSQRTDVHISWLCTKMFQQFWCLEFLAIKGPNYEIIFYPAECASSGRLVGAFLSVCALTVLCGLVLVAVFRLTLQKRNRSAGGTLENRDFHHTVKVFFFSFPSFNVTCSNA